MKSRPDIGLGMRLDCYQKTGRNLKRMLEEFLSMPAVGKRLKQEWKRHIAQTELQQ